MIENYCASCKDRKRHKKLRVADVKTVNNFTGQFARFIVSEET